MLTLGSRFAISFSYLLSEGYPIHLICRKLIAIPYFILRLT